MRGDGMKERERLTGSQSTLVNPGMHVCALLFQLLHLQRHIVELIAQIVDLVEVRPDRIVESLRERVRRRRHSRGRGMCCRVARSPGRPLRRGVKMVLRRSGAV